MLKVFLHFLTADTTFVTTQQFQKTLLDHTFHETAERFRGLISLDVPFRDTDYTGPPPASEAFQPRDKQLHLNFEEGLLRRFVVYFWKKEDYCGRVHMEYLPNSVEHLELSTSRQRFTVNTRQLPRNAKTIDLQFNEIFGSIDLQGLPDKLITFNIVMNKLSGKISLSNLPPNIEVIKVSLNWGLGERTLVYGALPESIQKIEMQFTLVNKVKPLSNDLRRRKIFVLKSRV